MMRPTTVSDLPRLPPPTAVCSAVSVCLPLSLREPRRDPARPPPDGAACTAGSTDVAATDGSADASDEAAGEFGTGRGCGRTEGPDSSSAEILAICSVGASGGTAPKAEGIQPWSSSSGSR